MISEQVKTLRDGAYELDNLNKTKYANLMVEAADTIEKLSAKLAAQNMERSTAYYNGGWIPCSERLPQENEKTEYYPTMFVTTKSGAVELGFYRCTDKEWYIYNEQIEEWDYVPSNKVVAWYSQPEPWKGE